MPLTHHCHDASGWDTLGYLTGAGQGGREEMGAHILLLAQSLTWCLCAGLSTGGQGNEFLICRSFCVWMRVTRGAVNLEAGVAVYWYTVLFQVLHWCCTEEVLFLVLTSVGMAVVDLSVCTDSAVWHRYCNLHFLLLGLFSVCSWGDAQTKTNGSRDIIPAKTLIIW